MKDKITAIVFSKNRPIQLFALLESMFKNTNVTQDAVHVLFKADFDFIYPMEQVREAFPEVNFHPEYDFRAQTMSLVNEAANKVVFFTDDDVFKDKVDFGPVLQLLDSNPDVVCFSLRLGTHLNYCYSVQAKQSLPKSATVREPWYCWRWKGTDWDWNYPLSVDGHVFRKNELMFVMQQAGDWKSPNTFEGNMSHLHPNLPHSQMMSFTTSKVFNIPHNKVQNEINNVFGGGSENELLEAWKQGKKIDIRTFQGIKNVSAHQLVPLTLIDR